MFVKSTRFKQLCQLLLSLIVAKFVRYSKVFFIITKFFSIYFTITGVKKIICYTEDFCCIEVRYNKVPLY